MTRNRTKVWDLNYVTVIMSATTKPADTAETFIPAGSYWGIVKGQCNV
jgi:hypothetical protein